jgi:hypothetical protein
VGIEYPDVYDGAGRGDGFAALNAPAQLGLAQSGTIGVFQGELEHFEVNLTNPGALSNVQWRAFVADVSGKPIGLPFDSGTISFVTDGPQWYADTFTPGTFATTGQKYAILLFVGCVSELGL